MTTQKEGMMKLLAELQNIFPEEIVIESNTANPNVRDFFVRFESSKVTSLNTKQIQAAFKREGLDPSSAQAGFLQDDCISFRPNNELTLINFWLLTGTRLKGCDLYLNLSNDAEKKIQAILQHCKPIVKSDIIDHPNKTFAL